MNIKVIAILIILLALGCTDSEVGSISEFNGKLNNDSVKGSGLVFQMEDSTLLIRTLIGIGDNYHEMNVSLNVQDFNTNIEHILTDSTASVAWVIGRDAVANRYLPSDANSFITVNIDFDNLTADGNLRFIGKDASDDEFEIEGSFKFSVGTIGNTIWDCDFDNGPVSNCRFL